MNTSNVTYLRALGGKTLRQSKPEGRPETGAANSMSPDEECKQAFRNLVDAKMKSIAVQLKSMDREDAEIVLEELSVSMLRVQRATQLAKMRLDI